MSSKNILDIVVNIRPTKLAFFIPNELDALLDVVDLCKKIWGGVFSLIIPVQSDYSVSPTFYHLLKISNPDIIVVYKPLEREKIAKIGGMSSLSYFEIVHFDLLKNIRLWCSAIPNLDNRGHKEHSKLQRMMDQFKNVIQDDDIEGNYQRIKKLWSNEFNETDKGLFARIHSKTGYFPHFILIITNSYDIVDLCLYWDIKGLYYHMGRSELLLVPKSILKDNKTMKYLAKNFIDTLNKEGAVINPPIAILSLSLEESEINDLFTSPSDNYFIESFQDDITIDTSCFFPLEYRNILNNLDIYINRFELSNIYPEKVVPVYNDRSVKIFYSLPMYFPSNAQYIILEISEPFLFDLPSNFRFESLFISASNTKVLLKDRKLCFLDYDSRKIHSIKINIPNPFEILQNFLSNYNIKIDKTGRTDPVLQIISFLEDYNESFQNDFLSEEVYNLFKQLSPVSRRKMEKFILTNINDIDEDIKNYLKETCYVSTNQFKMFSELTGILSLKKNILEELIKRKIIIRGYKVKCNHCNLKNWFLLGQLRETFICTGCGKVNSTPILQNDNTDLRLHYILNTLQQNAIDQDYFPEIKAIIELKRMRDTRYFFPSFQVTKDDFNIEIDGIAIYSDHVILIEAKQGGIFTDNQEHNLNKFSELLSEKIQTKIFLYSNSGRNGKIMFEI